jgi:hypothetical protein
MTPNQVPPSLRNYIDQPRATNFSKADVERWNRSRGRVTTTVRGSHVDIYVKLYRWAGYLWPVLLVAAALLSAVTLYKIIAPLASGRVEQIILTGGGKQ